MLSVAFGLGRSFLTDPKTSLVPHSRFPHVPAKVTVRADDACNGCPVKRAVGHETCAAIAPGEAATDAELVDARELAQWEWILHRLQFDAEGFAGADGGPFYKYNARSSYNYADFSSWEVVSVSGKNITLKFDGDPRFVALYFLRKYNEIGRAITGYRKSGGVQATDALWFSANSKLSTLLEPVVLQVIGLDVGAETITLATDKDCTAALPSTDEEPVTCKVYHQEGDRPLWRFIVEPEYFYGKQRTREIPAADVPSDGLLTLETVDVMHPGGFDLLHPTWTFEGLRIDTEEWEAVPQANARLFTPPGKGYVAFKTDTPSEADAGVALSDDLTVTYSSFRVSYWRTASSGCSKVGYSRCKWSVPDPSNSVGNMGWDDGFGVTGAGTAAEKHYVCLKKLRDEHDEFDLYGHPIDNGPDGFIETAVPRFEAASGAVRFPASGQCRQHGCCDQFEPAEHDSSDIAPLNANDDVAGILRELLGACNHKLQWLTLPVYDFKQPQRIKHPSLAWLVGYTNLRTNHGWHLQAEFHGMGHYGTTSTTFTDTDGSVTGHLGGQFLVFKTGPFENFNSYDPDGAGPGAFPAVVPGFTAARDPIDAGSALWAADELERIGVAAEKDTGALGERGLSQSTVAVAAQDVVIPNCELAAVGEQQRSQGSFTRGVEGADSVVRVAPLRQEYKLASLMGSRTVHSVASLGGDRYEIEFENGQHTWSQLNTGDPFDHYDTFDELFTFSGGGAWPICPGDGRSIDSFHEPHKWSGGRNRGAWRGDSIGFDDVVAGTVRRWVLESVTPFGGGAASNWGSKTYRKLNYTSGGTWLPPDGDMALGTTPETYGVMVPYTGYPLVEYQSGGVDLTLVDSVTRPATIPAGQYWRDGNRIYASPADGGLVLTVQFTTEGKAGTPYYNISFTVPTDWEITTAISVADWTTADVVTVTADGAALTYTTDLTGTNVVIIGGLADAGKEIAITLEFDTPAAAPMDHYSVDRNYLAYGQKRDVAIVIDPTGDVAALTAGDSVDFWKNAATMMPAGILEFSPYGVDSFVEVATSKVWYGTGEYFVPETWFDGQPEFGCWRVRDVPLLDHRGITPASLWNKIRGMFASLTDGGWVRTRFGPGRGAYVIAKGLLNERFILRHPAGEGELDGCGAYYTSDLSSTFVPGGSGNYFQQTSSTVSAGAALRVSSTSFGLPYVMKRWPPGMVILDARAELLGGVVTRTHYESPMTKQTDDVGATHGYDADEINDTTFSNIACAVIGFTSETDFTEIGKAPVSSQGQTVVDVTTMMQALYDTRNGSYPFGYGLVYMPGDGSFELPPFDWNPIYMDTHLSPEYGSCPITMENFAKSKSTLISWTNPFFNNIHIRFRYPGEELERTLIIPRFPAGHSPG